MSGNWDWELELILKIWDLGLAVPNNRAPPVILKIWDWDSLQGGVHISVALMVLNSESRFRKGWLNGLK